jgi:hypothetical protein
MWPLELKTLLWERPWVSQTGTGQGPDVAPVLEDACCFSDKICQLLSCIGASIDEPAARFVQVPTE